jgi:hypothetical protein
VSQLQDVGSPILLPLERAELLGRRSDPIYDGGGRRCLEQTGFQACLPLGDAGFQAFLPLCCLTSVLSALFIAAFLAALFPVSGLFLLSLFPVSGLFLLSLEKLQECRHL